MTPESQRIAIAEACGWVRHGDEGIYGCWDDPKGFTRSDAPDYLNDLNAMHEAERAIPEKSMAVYFEWLTVLHCIPEGSLSDLTPTQLFRVIHATAAQRAEAFLRTLGLWK